MHETAHILGPAGGATTLIPLYSSKVSAGFPSPAQDHLEMEISLDDLMRIGSPHIYLVRVIGESMRDIGLFDGDLMVVDRSMEPRPNATVIASLNGKPFVIPLTPKKPPKAPVDFLAKILDDIADEDGWAHLGALGANFTKLRPGFDPRVHGFKKLNELLEGHSHAVELQPRGTTSTGGQVLYARHKQPVK